MRADRKKTEKMLRTAKGQIEGILRMMEEDRYCIDISTQLFATQALLRSVNREILTAHLEGCIKHSADSEELSEKVDELTEVLERLLR